MARTLDPKVDRVILDAAMTLLARDGFDSLTMEAVAAEAGVGKPTLYRRHPDKVALVLAAVRSQLPDLTIPDLGDTRAEVRAAMDGGFPPDASAYLRLIGSLAAAERHHPELIGAFRDEILLPRRAAVLAALERGRDRGELSPNVTPEQALDLLAGPLLARAFAGVDTGPRWRASHFATWWRLVAREEHP